MLSGGVVYSPGSITLGGFSQGIAIAAGATLPPGAFIVPGAYTVTVPAVPPATGTTTVAGTGGYVQSDGTNVVLTAAGTVTMIGAQPAPSWPWVPPWPLPGHG